MVVVSPDMPVKTQRDKNRTKNVNIILYKRCWMSWNDGNTYGATVVRFRGSCSVFECHLKYVADECNLKCLFYEVSLKYYCQYLQNLWVTLHMLGYRDVSV